jgi:primosomal protein N' (replication factor Y)
MRLGVIGAVGPPSDFPVDRLKPLAEVVYPFPALTADLLLELARWMAGYYAAPMDSVIEAMIPAAVRRGARVKEQRFLSVAAENVPRRTCRPA